MNIILYTSTMITKWIYSFNPVWKQRIYDINFMLGNLRFLLLYCGFHLGPVVYRHYKNTMWKVFSVTHV